MTAEARFELLEVGEVSVGQISGEIDVSNAGDVADRIANALSNDALGLILDLSLLRYLDSSGIAVMFGLVRSLDSRRQRLILVVPGDSPIRRVLELTKITASAEMENSLEQARSRARSWQSDPRPA